VVLGADVHGKAAADADAALDAVHIVDMIEGRPRALQLERNEGVDDRGSSPGASISTVRSMSAISRARALANLSALALVRPATV
jgi:hypothetical protein